MVWQTAAITQLVECLAVNQNVSGSSPDGGVSFLLFYVTPSNCSEFSFGIHHLYLLSAQIICVLLQGNKFSRKGFIPVSSFRTILQRARSLVVERPAHNRVVVGSNPSRPIPFVINPTSFYFQSAITIWD